MSSTPSSRDRDAATEPHAPPRPGAPVRGSQTGRPIMALLDLLGRRWTLRVLWELRGDRVLSFRALQAACDDVSPTVLNRRLAELRSADIVTRDDGYRLSQRGHSLVTALAPLNDWAQSWLASSEPTSSKAVDDAD